MDYSRPELADRLAAEYAAGLLRGAARRRFELLLPAHPQLRGAVRAWQDRLMPLTQVVEPQPPSAAVWPRIEQALYGTGAAAAPAAPAGWWRRLAFWRGFSALAGVATVALAVLLATPAPVRPPIVVVLAPQAPAAGTAPGAVAPASFVASITADGRAMVTKPVSTVALEPNKSLELWSLPPSGAPRSLGLIAADKATVVQRGKVLEGTDAFAVTLEAAGGSPDGKPHGPILYVGKLTL
ncbi:MAG TPA: anti-sigma factor [Burkholderiaceae bacterium]|nr:anti-sigma factor [Burkholderiaceae bacterium]